jgi:single-strand DNA-binding protein
MALLSVSGIARAVADPDLKFSPSGVAVCRLRGVASRSKKNERDEWEDAEQLWFDVTGFRQIAEQMAETIVKGQQFQILGRIYEEEWETNEGEKRKSIKIFADAIAAIPKRENSQSQGGQRQQQGWGQQQSSDPWAGAPQAEEPPF